MSSIIANNKREKKFYLRLNGKEAYLKYKLKEGNYIDLMSIFVPKEFRGKNIGASITEEALKYAEKNDMCVIASCPFVRTFIRRKRNYRHLLA